MKFTIQFNEEEYSNYKNIENELKEYKNKIYEFENNPDLMVHEMNYGFGEYKQYLTKDKIINNIIEDYTKRMGTYEYNLNLLKTKIDGFNNLTSIQKIKFILKGEKL